MAKTWIQSAEVVLDDVSGALLVTGDAAAGIEVKYANIDAASADADAGNTLIAAVAEKRICVLGALFITEDEVLATLYSGVPETGTALSGPMALDRGGFCLPITPSSSFPWLTTVAGKELNLKLGSAFQVGGWIAYYEAD